MVPFFSVDYLYNDLFLSKKSRDGDRKKKSDRDKHASLAASIYVSASEMVH